VSRKITELISPKSQHEMVEIEERASSFVEKVVPMIQKISTAKVFFNTPF
jgi:hypothetical protein